MPLNSRLDAFLAFSAKVTAFNEVALYGTGQAEAYLQAVDTVVGPAVTDALLAAYAPLAEQPVEALRGPVFGDERLGPVARNIVKLWYAGTWYALPAAWQDAYGPAPQDGTFVVSPSSYVEGLLWPAIGAHPPGAKAQGFGSWAHPPNIPGLSLSPAKVPAPPAAPRSSDEDRLHDH